MKKITVYHFNSHLHGGAAIAAQRLFNSLAAYDDLNIRFYSKDYSPEKNYFRYGDNEYFSFAERLMNRIPFLENRKSKLLKNLDKSFDGRPQGLEQFDSPVQYKTKVPQPFPDIIHLHWVSDFIDYPSFFADLPDNIPIVWTLHDMNAFTGGCHYSNGCSKFNKACESCPQLGPYSAVDLAEYCFADKQKAYAGKNIHIAADSEWLREEANQSALFKNASSVRCIHYGLDATLFAPLNKESCRNALNINVETEEFVLCFGADDIDNRRKGVKELIEAVELLIYKGVKIICLLFGHGKFEIQNKINTIQYGQIQNKTFLNIVYNAADLFIMPSLEEAFGQTCLEAMSCGVPVVGFNTGGIPDMVTNYETGMLAETGNVTDLADKIFLLLNNKELRDKISINCRNKIISDFTLEVQAGKYYELYKSISN